MIIKKLLCAKSTALHYQKVPEADQSEKRMMNTKIPQAVNSNSCIQRVNSLVL